MQAFRLTKSILPACALWLTGSAAAVDIGPADNGLQVIGADGLPMAAAEVSIIRADGSITRTGTTSSTGYLCVLGESASATSTNPGCIALPDGRYRLFAGTEPPVDLTLAGGRVAFEAGAVAPVAAPAEGLGTGAKVGIAVGGIALVAAAGGGGGGGGGGDNPPDDAEVSVNVSPLRIEAVFQREVSPCPSPLGDLTVTNTGNRPAVVSVGALTGITLTGAGQTLAAGNSTGVAVSFNCVVDETIDGAVEVGITADSGLADSEVVRIRVEVVDAAPAEVVEPPVE